MQEVSAPPLADTRDIEKFIPQPCRHDQAPSGQQRPAGETDSEPWSGAPVDSGHRAGDQLTAVSIRVAATPCSDNSCCCSETHVLRHGAHDFDGTASFIGRA